MWGVEASGAEVGWVLGERWRIAWDREPGRADGLLLGLGARPVPSNVVRCLLSSTSRMGYKAMVNPEALNPAELRAHEDSTTLETSRFCPKIGVHF